MIVLGLDFETTGLSVTADRILEVGAVLWDTEKNSPLAILSEYVDHLKEPVAISKEITDLTGIREEHITRYGQTFEEVYERLSKLASFSEYIVAHNGSQFDKPLLENHCALYGRLMFLTPWIDTSKDVPYSERITTRKLSYLAAEHNFVNPFPHRAIFDVLTMLKVGSNYSWEETARLSKERDVTLRAMVDFNDRNLAKEAGYRWYPDRKLWLKIIKESQVSGEIARTNNFKVQVME